MLFLKTPKCSHWQQIVRKIVNRYYIILKCQGNFDNLSYYDIDYSEFRPKLDSLRVFQFEYKLIFKHAGCFHLLW